VVYHPNEAMNEVLFMQALIREALMLLRFADEDN
jgi:hypothetical protein